MTRGELAGQIRRQDLPADAVAFDGQPLTRAWRALDAPCHGKASEYPTQKRRESSAPASEAFAAALP